eukprot:TRINITY_DN14832_c0_g2_i1.p1 TRINITY_DN14832_c0_g2~~TRINITY_DN14832_c0_g2_i1.p1  ORF type:complete len:842 (+),score=178.07 TRINITY_DN14832_c0_g2_i1:2236-4761(+)
MVAKELGFRRAMGKYKEFELPVLSPAPPETPNKKPMMRKSCSVRSKQYMQYEAKKGGSVTHENNWASVVEEATSPKCDKRFLNKIMLKPALLDYEPSGDETYCRLGVMKGQAVSDSDSSEDPIKVVMRSLHIEESSDSSVTSSCLSSSFASEKVAKLSELYCDHQLLSTTAGNYAKLVSMFAGDTIKDEWCEGSANEESPNEDTATQEDSMTDSWSLVKPPQWNATPSYCHSAPRKSQANYERSSRVSWSPDLGVPCMSTTLFTVVADLGTTGIAEVSEEPEAVGGYGQLQIKRAMKHAEGVTETDELRKSVSSVMIRQANESAMEEIMNMQSQREQQLEHLETARVAVTGSTADENVSSVCTLLGSSRAAKLRTPSPNDKATNLIQNKWEGKPRRGRLGGKVKTNSGSEPTSKKTSLATAVAVKRTVQILRRSRSSKGRSSDDMEEKITQNMRKLTDKPGELTACARCKQQAKIVRNLETGLKEMFNFKKDSARKLMLLEQQYRKVTEDVCNQRAALAQARESHKSFMNEVKNEKKELQKALKSERETIKELNEKLEERGFENDVLLEEIVKLTKESQGRRAVGDMKDLRSLSQKILQQERKYAKLKTRTTAHTLVMQRCEELLMLSNAEEGHRNPPLDIEMVVDKFFLTMGEKIRDKKSSDEHVLLKRDVTGFFRDGLKHVLHCTDASQRTAHELVQHFTTMCSAVFSVVGPLVTSCNAVTSHFYKLHKAFQNLIWRATGITAKQVQTDDTAAILAADLIAVATITIQPPPAKAKLITNVRKLRQSKNSLKGTEKVARKSSENTSTVLMTSSLEEEEKKSNPYVDKLLSRIRNKNGNKP